MNILRPVLPICVFSFGFLFTANASAVVGVTVTDGSGLTKPCGDLVSAIREKDSLTVTTSNGSCLGSSGSVETPSVVDHMLGDVDEGHTRTVALATDAVVKLDSVGNYNTYISKQPAYGRVSLSGSIATYIAPTPGTVENPVQDDFEYGITDASGSDTASVFVKLNPVDPDIPGDTNCTEPADGLGLDCKGDLRAWPAGTIFNETLHVGATHAWSFVYDGHRGSFVPVDTGHLLELSVSLIPGQFNNLPDGCYVEQVTLEQKLKFSVDDRLFYCKLIDGQKYYFNMKTTGNTNRSYDLIVY